MNLYDVIGAVAVAAGAGAAYGASEATGLSWELFTAAILIGGAVFLLLRRVTGWVHRVKPRALLAMYIASPIATIMATSISAWFLRVLGAALGL